MADDTKNLQKSYSALNEKLTTLFDESGVRRSFTVPYIDGQDMSDHVSAVGQAAQNAGGLTNNLLTTAHHSSGKGWGSGDGHTVGHPGEVLRTTLVPKDSENAKAAIKAAQKHLDNISSFLGDDEPAVKTAQGQLDLVKKTDGVGMNLLDFGVMLTQLMYGPNQAIARAHQGTKPGGHSPKLSPPHSGNPEVSEGGAGKTAPDDGNRSSMSIEGVEDDSTGKPPAIPPPHEQPVLPVDDPYRGKRLSQA